MSGAVKAAMAALGAVALAVVGLAPAAAELSPAPTLTCTTGSIWNTNLTIKGALNTGTNPPITLTGPVSASWDGGETWEVVDTTLEVPTYAPSASHVLTGFFDGRGAWPVTLKWETNGGTATCDTYHYPIDASISGPANVEFGEQVRYLVETRAPTVPWTDTFVVVAYLYDGQTYTELGTAPLTSWGRVSLLDVKVPRSGEVVFYVFDEETDPDHWWPWNSGHSVFTEVTHRTPYLDYNGTVVLGQRVYLDFWMGDRDSSWGTSIQRKSGGRWLEVTDTVYGGGSFAAQHSFKPPASGSYRVTWFPSGKSYDRHYTYFTVKVLPKVSLSAPSSAKRGTVVAFTVSHPLATSGTGKLQYLSGTTWKTAKTFALSSAKKTTVTLKVNATHKWRAVVGSNASATRTLTMK